MISLFSYYIFYLLIIFSFIGYGILFEKYFKIYENPVENIFVYLFLGFGFLIIFSFFYNFLLLNIKIFNLFFLLFGILPLVKEFNKLRKQINITIIISSVFFIGLIISKSHEDFFSYHYQYVAELSENIIKIGLTNLDQKYAYSSIFSYLQSIFNLPYVNLKTIHVPIFVMFIAIVGYLFIEIVNKKSLNKNILIFILLFLILKYKRLSEFGYDYITNFFILFIFLEFLYKKKIFQNKAIIFFSSIAILIKVTSIFFFPLFFLLLRKKNLIKIKKNIRQNFIFKNLILIVPVLILVLNSFISNGCLFYGLKLSCFSKEKISWSSDYSKINYEKKLAEKWAKGYFHTKEKIDYSEKNLYKNKNWIPNWIDIHFKTRILKFLLISLTISIFLKWFVFYNKSKNESIFEAFLISVSVLIWFFSIPQLRFGSTFILLLSFYLFSYFLKFGNNFKMKNFMVIFSLAIFYFNLSNVARIKKEFERNDLYKFQNFPFIAIPNYNFEKLTDKNGIIFHRYIIKNGEKIRSKDIIKKSYSENKIFNLVRPGTNARFYKDNYILYIINDGE
tara:strand:+ start:1265 stop:2947 length:1683 start_codon:yes stop_codon:yes gene_type:complete